MGAFVQLIEGLRAQTLSLPLPEVVEHVIEHSGLVAHYANEREGQDRIENLRELVNAAAAFLAEEGIVAGTPANFGVAGLRDPGPQASVAAPVAQSAGAGVEILDAETPEAMQVTPLAAFLAHASLEAGENQAGEGSDAVQMMTVHSAKGLEFDAVFITGLEEGLFPHENAVSDPQGLEEERRLMYVAITRARRRLYLSFSQTRMLHGHTRYNMRSRFLDELPPTLLKWLGPRLHPGAYGGAARGPAETASWSASPGRRAGANAVDTGRLSRDEQRAAHRFDRGVAFRIGQSVSHERFGEGVIVSIEGSGDDARAQVNFGRDGIKWLALSIAKLQPAG